MPKDAGGENRGHGGRLKDGAAGMEGERRGGQGEEGAGRANGDALAPRVQKAPHTHGRRSQGDATIGMV